MDKVSIIIPLFNAESSLKECLGSVLAQDYANFEVICIDDGSLDKSALIIQELQKKDARIKYIYQKNQGVSAARNLGINLAEGNFITFVDSDDILYSRYLTSLCACMKDAVELTICGVNEEHRVGIRVQHVYKEKSYDLSKDGSFYVENLRSIAFWGPWAKLFYTKVIKDNNLQFDTKLSLGEDTKFLLDYLKCICHVSTLEYIGYEYKYAPSSLSRAGNYKNEYKVYSYAIEEMSELIQRYGKDLVFDEFVLDKYLNYLMLKLKSLINENMPLRSALTVLKREKSRFKKINIPILNILKMKYGFGRSLIMLSFITSISAFEIYVKAWTFVFLFNLKYKIKAMVSR